MSVFNIWLATGVDADESGRPKEKAHKPMVVAWSVKLMITNKLKVFLFMLSWLISLLLI